MTRIWKLTDGTDTVELIDGTGNVLHIKEWNPQMALYKNGGVFQNSPFAQGRRLQDRQFSNAIEEATFVAGPGAGQNDVIEAVQDLERLLEKAADYWVAEWQSTPVYLVVKADNETNTRYAIVHKGEIAEHGDIFDILFDEQSRFNGVPLLVERGHWRSVAPGASLTAIPISTVESYDGRAMGTVDSARARESSTGDNVFVSNRHNEAQLTDVYFDDGGVFSSNVLDDVSSPIDFPFGAVGDALYCGIDTSVSDSGPFNSLYFGLERGNTLAGGGWDFLWEYYDGSSWVTLTVQDNTDTGLGNGGLEQSGTVHWETPADWAATAVNGVTAYWVRFRLTNTTATPGDTPRLNHKGGVYTIPWNYVDVAEADLGGDIPLGIEIQVTGRSLHTTSPEHGLARGVMVGARTHSRGGGFRSFIPLADEQTPIGVAVGTIAGASSFVDDVQSPAGRRLQIETASPPQVGINLFTVSFNTAGAANYAGRYRAFLICNRDGSTTNFTDLQFLVRNESNTDTLFASDKFDVTSTTRGNYIDFGQVVFPDHAFLVLVQGSIDDATDDLDAYALVLMPVDEWAAHYVTDISQGSAGILRQSLLAESTYQQLTAEHGTLEKGAHRAQLRQQGGADTKVVKWKVRGGDPPQLQPNSRQRLHFFFQRDPANKIANLEDFCTAVKLSGWQQYKSGRGSR